MSYQAVSLLLLLLAAPAQADKSVAAAPAAKVLLETWQAAYFEGLKVGYLHMISTQTGEGKEARIRTTVQMYLVIKRYGSVLPIRIEQTADETLDGKVRRMGIVQQLGESPKMTLSATVEDGKLLLKLPDGTTRSLPWDDSALGLYAQERLFAIRKAKPGDRFKFLSYEILLPAGITIEAVVGKPEKVDRLVTKKTAEGKTIVDREPVLLLRVETMPLPFTVGGTTIQLPKKTLWLDSKLNPVRGQFEMPGLGLITLYNTTRDAALKEGVAPELLPDLGLNISIPLRQTIDDPYRTTEAVYRVTLKDKLTRVFTVDARQQTDAFKDNSFELKVKAVRGPGEDDMAVAPDKEYLESNTFIDSSDARIKEVAREVAGKLTDPWRKALALEQWVHRNMRISTSVGFPPASRIARDLQGDCRQHALLLAALCRAAGVPSRTAIGLIYVREEGRSPFFGFHMWTEVWVRGRWTALDATLGQGGVGATHLKMADQSWARTETLAPLLPIAQVLGKLQIDVLSSK